MDTTLTRFVRLSAYITMLPLLAFLLPQTWLKLGGAAIADPAGLFYLRHWGLLVFCLGSLLLWAAPQPALRRPVLLAVAVEKAGLVAMVALSWSEPQLASLRGAALFDGLCVIAYSLLLWRLAARPAGA